MTVSAAPLPLGDGRDRPGRVPAGLDEDLDDPGLWEVPEPWWLDDLPADLEGTRLEDLPPDPLAGFEREVTDADAPIKQSPGGALAAVLESVDLAGSTEVDLVDVIAAAGRMASWAAALELTATAELTERAGAWRGVGCDLPAPGGRGMQRIEAERMAAAEVAAAQNISEGFARFKVDFAQAVRRLPLTRIALAAGRIDVAKARAIVEAVMVCDDEAAVEVEARVIDRAGGQTLANLKRSLRRAVIAADPGAAEERRQRQIADRNVAHYPGEDGTGALVWTGPLHEQEAFWVWLTAAADAAKAPADTRTLAQRRSDVLADIAANGLAGSVTHTGADLPLRHGRRAHISVVVAASTLLGLDDEPGELEGAGPITAELARRIAADGTWRRLLTDPATGRMVELSEDSYEPSQELRDHVIARDRYCRWPGCRVPANRCDLDHAIPHPVGPTHAKNLEPLHRPHHVAKTHTDITVVIEEDGTTVWTFPSGHVYRVPPTRVLEHPDLNPQALRNALRALTEGDAGALSIQALADSTGASNPGVLEVNDTITNPVGGAKDNQPAGSEQDPSGTDPDPPGTGPDPPRGGPAPPPRLGQRPPPPDDDIPPF